MYSLSGIRELHFEKMTITSIYRMVVVLHLPSSCDSVCVGQTNAGYNDWGMRIACDSDEYIDLGCKRSTVSDRRQQCTTTMMLTLLSYSAVRVG